MRCKNAALWVRTNTFALFLTRVCRVSEGAAAQMRCGYGADFAHRGVFAAEAEVVKRRRKEVIDGTPLLVASRNGRLEVAETLLEKGADVNYQDPEGTSSLHIAASCQSNDNLAQLNCITCCVILQTVQDRLVTP